MKRALDKGKGKEKDAEDGTKKKSKKEETILSKGPAVSSRLPKPPVLPKAGIKDLGKNSRVGSGFKVPTLPLPTGRGNVRRDEDDVFLDNAGPKEDVSDLEAGNKLVRVASFSACRYTQLVLRLSDYQKGCRAATWGCWHSEAAS